MKDTSSPSVKILAKRFESKTISLPNSHRSVPTSTKTSKTTSKGRFSPNSEKNNHDVSSGRFLEGSSLLPSQRRQRPTGKVFTFSNLGEDFDNRRREKNESFNNKGSVDTDMSDTFSPPRNSKDEDISVASPKILENVQNGGDKEYSTPIQLNKDSRNKSITPSDEVISSRRKMMMLGLKEHLNNKINNEESIAQEVTFMSSRQDVTRIPKSGVMQNQSDCLIDTDMRKTNGLNEEHYNVDVNKSETQNSSRIKSVSGDDHVLVLTKRQLKVTSREDDAFTISHSSIENMDKSNDTREDDGFTISRSSIDNMDTSNDTRDDDGFTISRSSIDNMDTPNDISEPHHDSTNYLSRIVNHCQIAVDKLTPRIHKNNERATTNDILVDHASGLAIKTQDCKSNQLNLDHLWSNLGLQKNVKILVGNISRAKHARISYFTTLKIMTQTYGRMIVKSVTQASKESLLMTTSLLFSMISALYPTTPRFNCGVSSFLLLVNVHLTNHNREGFFLALTTLILMSSIVDIDWLISSEYVPHPLTSKIDTVFYIVKQETSVTRAIIWYIILLGIPMKVMALVAQLRCSKKGRSLMHRIWSKSFVFFPPFSDFENEQIEVERRIIAIIWFEALCALLIISLTIYAQIHLSWSPVFTTASPFTPLVNILYAKGITGLLYVVGVLHHTNALAVLSEFGCLQRYNLDEREAQPKVLIDHSFLQFNGFLKILDIIISILVCISLVLSIPLGGLDQPKEVRVTFGAMIVLISLSSIHGLLLAVVVFCYARRSLSQNGDNQTPTSLPTFNHHHEQSFRYEGDHNVEERSVTDFNHHEQQFRNKHIFLDSNVQCSPAQFQRDWRIFLLSEQSFQNVKVAVVPTIDECCSHFSTRRIYSVAYGDNDESNYRIFVIAKANVVKFLGEFIVNVQTRCIDLKIKSNDLTLVPTFIECLQLEILLGGLYLEL